MRIKEAHIFGFGKWQQKNWQFNDDDIVQITGDNEAGKSTLRQFILYILFGQKPRDVEKYIPNDGAVLGGRLRVAGLDNEDITIERVYQKNKNKATVYFNNGTMKDESWLQQAMQGMDRAHYEAIFTFDSMDLQRIKSLHHDDLHEVLLTIGMIGSERIYESEKKLEKELQLLFKPYGKKPIINTLLQELKELKKQLASAQEKESVYENHLTELKEKELLLERVNEQKKMLEDTHSYYERIRAYYPNIEEYYLLSQKRKRLDAPLTFPTDGINRLHQYKEAILPIRSELLVLEKNMQSLEKEIEKSSSLTDEQFNKLVNQKQLLVQIEGLSEELGNLQETVNKEVKEIEEKLNSLQLSPLHIDLDALTLSFQTEEEWSTLVKEKEQIIMEESYIKAEIEGVQRKDKAIEKDIDRLQAKALTDNDRRNYANLLAEQEESSELAKQSKKYKRWKTQYKKVGKTVFLVSLAILTMAVLISFLTNPIIGYLGGGLAIVLTGGYWVYGNTLEKWLKPEGTNQSKPLNNEERIRIQGILEDQYKLENQIVEYKREKTKIQREMIQLEERLQTINRQKYRLENRIKEQVSHFPFLDGIPLTYWPKLYSQLQQVKAKNRSVLEIKEKVKAKNQDIQRLKEQLATDFSYDLESIEVKIKTETQKRETLHYNKKQYDEFSQQRENILEKIRPYQEEIHRLLSSANTDNEEVFIKLGEEYAEAKRMDDRLKQLKDSLLVLFSESELEQWRNGKIEAKQTVDNKLLAIKEDIDQVTHQIQKLQKEISDRQAAISILETSADSSIVRYELAMKQEELRHYAHKWSVHQYALASLERTKTSFSEKYLPLVLENASRYFNELTLGNYIRIYFDEENHSLLAEHKNGFNYTIDSLSQGTLDQLYIALRLGLAHVTSSTMALPFLIDDGFVHFDPERRKQMMRILEEISTRHQVIYFSTVHLDRDVKLYKR
ncbi:uncharacterized protein YhaN [Gracilibacillus halotolerans]|uniref:Uncharacterized protein YhaN n=1 Tax=Gracilibacillus halotolerans TaxID=74386 RepID=A0A841RP00_9BACI|nr:AAA family ATPase [Gracilibacillus halotolerans]MBB6512664.1 uncharacterized protein YhaN [Gracilibacillus halotolerans]